MESRTGFGERGEEGRKGSKSSLDASPVRDRGQGGLGSWSKEWGKRRNRGKCPGETQVRFPSAGTKRKFWAEEWGWDVEARQTRDRKGEA